MIEYLKGKITDLSPTAAILEIGGIGYMIHISLTTYSGLGHQESVQLYIHEVIREDAHLLYGFFTKEEREMFLLLISVSGIGANTARMMLSSLSVAEMKQIIFEGDSTALKNIKGIGLKTAQRIIIDLKDKIGRVSGDLKLSSSLESKSTIKSETSAALIMLGFNQLQVNKVLDKIFTESPTIPIEQAIRIALKML
jgi:holliday junction DNA helicase RuvA